MYGSCLRRPERRGGRDRRDCPDQGPAAGRGSGIAPLDSVGDWGLPTPVGYGLCSGGTAAIGCATVCPGACKHGTIPVDIRPGGTTTRNRAPRTRYPVWSVSGCFRRRGSAVFPQNAGISRELFRSLLCLEAQRGDRYRFVLSNRATKRRGFPWIGTSTSLAAGNPTSWFKGRVGSSRPDWP